MPLEVKVAIISGIFGILGGTIPLILGQIFPSIGYFIKRIIEKTGIKDRLDLIQKALDINQKVIDQNIPVKFNIELALKESIGRNATYQLFDFNRKNNLTNILDNTQKDLSEDERKTTIDQTWFLNFSNMASNISDDKVQELWSNILTKEIKNPGSFSLRTIEALKNISKEEATLFEKVAKYCINDSFIFMFNEYVDLADFDINYTEIIKLEEAGLLSTKLVDLRVDYNFSFHLKYLDKIIVFYLKNVNEEIERETQLFRGIKLTNIAQELFKLLALNIDQKYLNKIIEMNSTVFNLKVLDKKT